MCHWRIMQSPWSKKSLNMEHSECYSTRMLHGVETFFGDMGIFCKDDIACPSRVLFLLYRSPSIQLANSDTSKFCHKVSTVCPLKQTLCSIGESSSHISLCHNIPISSCYLKQHISFLFRSLPFPLFGFTKILLSQRQTID